MTFLLSRFLPREPDVLGLLDAQAQVTVGGMAAFVGWAHGEPGADVAVRDAEHEADERKRALWLALREAFVTPLGAEDIFFLSSKLDAVLRGAKDVVREAEVLGLTPDAACAGMATALAEGVGELAIAFEALRGGRGAFERATAAADAAHTASRQSQRIYREAMAALLGGGDAREIDSRREVYRRLEGLSEDITRVTDRVWYLAVKET